MHLVLGKYYDGPACCPRDFTACCGQLRTAATFASHAEEPRASNRASLPASGNAAVLFTFGIKNISVCEPFRDASTRISNVKFLTEAALYLHYLELGFLSDPKFFCNWPLILTMSTTCLEHYQSGKALMCFTASLFRAFACVEQFLACF